MTKILLVLLAALSLTIAACSGAADSHTAAPLEIVVEADDFSFSPAVIEAEVGRPLRLTLHNVGQLEHDWSISHIHVSDVREHSAHSVSHGDDMHGQDPDLHVAAMAGERGMVEFTPTEPGEYKIVCNVPGHEEAGMVGTLTVTGKKSSH
jgi:uncharacterized cupredoxin-like copper-binding protein